MKKNISIPSPIGSFSILDGFEPELSERLQSIRSARLGGAKYYSLDETREILSKTIKNAETPK